MSVWRRFVSLLSGRPELPAGFTGRLDGDEDVLAVAALARGGHLVLTQLGLWVPEGAQARRIGWQWVSKACLLYTSPSPRDRTRSRMPSSA